MRRLELINLMIALPLGWFFACQSGPAASAQLKPVLKAIDPSQAKMDTSNQKAPPPSPNPNNAVRGKPISQPAAKRSPQLPGPTPPLPGQPTAGAGYPPQGAGYPPPNSPPVFPSENLIPEFGQPLPQFPAQSPRQQGSQPNYGQGFSTYRAPDSTAPATPLTGTQSYGGPAPAEARIVRLEQIAFGSTYPEHELDDRIDHLETEVFGTASSGDMSSRLAKLEAKLGGQGAFGQTAQAPVASPVVATGYGQDSLPPPTRSYPQSRDSSGAEGSDYSSRSQRSFSNPVGTAGSAQTAQPVEPLSTPSVAGGERPGQRQVAIAKPVDLSFPSGATAGSTTADFDFERVVNGIPFDSKAGDYFPQIRRGPNGTVARWTRFPVRVHVPQGSPQSWQMSLESGIKKWAQYVQLTVAQPNEAADIDVVWINHLPPNALGITRVQVQRGILQSVIYLLRPTYYLPDVPERALSGVFLHELGHALGIFGHSDFKDDLMVPIELSMAGRKRGVNTKYKFGNITPRDVNTLKRIYETPTVPSGFTSPQPTDWTFKTGNLPTSQ